MCETAQATIATDMARIAASNFSDTAADTAEVQRLVQDACMADQRAYVTLWCALNEMHRPQIPLQVKVFGICELSPEEQSRLGRSLASLKLASFRRRAGLLSLALLAELPSRNFDQAGLEQTPKVFTPRPQTTICGPDSRKQPHVLSQWPHTTSGLRPRLRNMSTAVRILPVDSMENPVL